MMLNLSAIHVGASKSLAGFWKARMVIPSIPVLSSDVLCFSAVRKPSPSIPDQLSELQRSKSLARRLTLYQSIRQQLETKHLKKLSPEERLVQQKVWNEASQWFKNYPSRKELPLLLGQLKAQGYALLFKEDVLGPWGPTREILEAFQPMDSSSDWRENPLFDDTMEDIMAGESILSIGQLLKPYRYEACFIQGKKKIAGYFLFSTTKERLNWARLWHELFHALQHQAKLYENFSKTPGSFYLREMEAHQFVIDHHQSLTLPERELMKELKAWSFRVAEYLESLNR